MKAIKTLRWRGRSIDRLQTMSLRTMKRTIDSSMLPRTGITECCAVTGRFFQQRYQLQQGREVNLFEQEVHYIIGSGNHARSYLNLSAGGVLTQLPVTWYPAGKALGNQPGIRPERSTTTSRARSTTAACSATTPHRSLPTALIATVVRICFRQELPSGYRLPALPWSWVAACGIGWRREGDRGDSTSHCQSSPIES